MTGACSISVGDQLASILSLEAGWLDGDGSAYDPAALDRVRVALESIVAAGVPVPFIYPTVTNGVSVEWDTSTHGISLQFDPDIATAHLLAVPDATDDIIDEQCQIADLGSSGLLRMLRGMFDASTATSTRTT